MHLWIRAFCFVANARDSYGYHCALRLASHPDPPCLLSARLVQSFPRINSKTSICLHMRRMHGAQEGRKPLSMGVSLPNVLVVPRTSDITIFEQPINGIEKNHRVRNCAHTTRMRVPGQPLTRTRQSSQK